MSPAINARAPGVARGEHPQNESSGTSDKFPPNFGALFIDHVAVCQRRWLANVRPVEGTFFVSARLLLVRTGVIAVVTAMLCVAVAASAHVTAADAVQGGYTKATLTVPTEKDDADTVKVEINLPIDTPVASVSLRPAPVGP